MAASDDTQQRLLQAAGEIFAEKGFQATTVREICGRASVNNIAAINYYFGDKERLYHDTLVEACQCRMREAPLPIWPEGTPAALKLRLFIQTLVEKVVMIDSNTPRWHMQLMMRELSNPSAAGIGLVREFIRPVYQQLWSILGEVLPAGVDEQKLHLIAFSIIGQCLYHRLARPVIQLVVGEDEHRTYTASVLAEHITTFTLRALGLAVPALEKEVVP